MSPLISSYLNTAVANVKGSYASATTPIKSVFDYEYIPTSKAGVYTAVTSGYFTLDKTVSPFAAADDDPKQQLRKLGELDADGSLISKSMSPKPDAYAKAKSVFEVSAPQRQPYWKIIVTILSEVHEENFSMHNTLSDSVSVFATGAKPIVISITGYVLFAPKDDHLYWLLRHYVDAFRSRQLAAQSQKLYFMCQDTEFGLDIQSFALGYTVEMETYVPFTISGVAYDYTTHNSNEKLLRSYYGKTPGMSAQETATTNKEETKTKDGEISKKLPSETQQEK